MPNPYHDETGQFCSKDQMRSAIERAAQEGKLEVYFQLRTDFENIEKNRFPISVESIRHATTSGNMLANATSDEEAEGILALVKDKIGGTNDVQYSYHPTFELLRQLTNNKNIGDEVKNRAVRELPLPVKEAFARAYADRRGWSNPNYDYPVPDVRAFIQGETSERIFHSVVEMDGFTFEEKYLESKNHRLGLATLAASSPKLFFSEPTLGAELVEEYEKAGKYDKGYYLKPFASSPDPEHQKIVVEAEEFYPLGDAGQKLVANPHATPEILTKFIKRTAMEKIGDFPTLMREVIEVSRYSGMPKHREILSNRIHRAVPWGPLPKPTTGIPERFASSITRLEELVSKGTDLTSAEADEKASLNAIRNSYQPGYNELTDMHKKTLKDIRKAKNTIPNGLRALWEQLDKDVTNMKASREAIRIIDSIES